MKFLHATDLHSSGEEGRFVYELGKMISHQKSGIEELLNSTEEREEAQKEISKILESLRSESEAPSNWSVTRQIGVLKTLSMYEEKRDIDELLIEDSSSLFKSVKGHLAAVLEKSGIVDPAEKLFLLQLTEHDDLSSAINMFSTEALLNFVKYNQKEAWELFTNQNGNRYEFDSSANSFLEKGVDLVDILPSSQTYIMLDGYGINGGNAYAVRTPAGYKIFAPKDSNKTVKININEQIQLINTLDKKQQKLLQESKYQRWGHISSESKEFKEMEGDGVRNDFLVQNYKIIVEKSKKQSLEINGNKHLLGDLLGDTFFTKFDAKLESLLKTSNRGDLGVPLPTEDFVILLDDMISGLAGESMEIIFMKLKKDYPDMAKTELETKIGGFGEQLKKFIDNKIENIVKEGEVLELNNRMEISNLLANMSISGYKSVNDFVKAFREENWSLRRTKEFIAMMAVDNKGFSKEKQSSLLFLLKKDKKINLNQESNEYLKNSQQAITGQLQLRRECSSNPFVRKQLQKSGIDIYNSSLKELRSSLETIMLDFRGRKQASKSSFWNKDEGPLMSSVKTSSVLSSYLDNEDMGGLVESSYIEEKEGLKKIEVLLLKLNGNSSQLKVLRNKFKYSFREKEKTAIELNVATSSPEKLKKFFKEVEERKTEIIYQRAFEEAQRAYEASHPQVNVDSDESQRAIKNAAKISAGMPAFTISRFDESGLPVFEVGQPAQEVVVDKERDKMYPANIDSTGTMSDFVKFPVSAANIPGIQITSSVTDGNFWTADYGVTNANRSMGVSKMQNIFRQIYPLGEVISLNEDVINGWKNLQIELRARGRGMPYFWQQMGAVDAHGEILDEKGGNIALQVRNAVASARVGNFDWLDNTEQVDGGLYEGVLKKDYGFDDRLIAQLGVHLKNSKISIVNFMKQHNLYDKDHTTLDPKFKSDGKWIEKWKNVVRNL